MSVAPSNRVGHMMVSTIESLKKPTGIINTRSQAINVMGIDVNAKTTVRIHIFFLDIFFISVVAFNT
jgi:hypothetical protein